MTFLNYQHFYLVGIKGVAMTALAQCLLDAGKTVAGCDVAEEFVTSALLGRLPIKFDQGFQHALPEEVECVVYTAAHGGSHNLIVLQAQAANLAVFSHAQALAEMFNLKQGIAVAGVGGKSTVSAMITWILDRAGRQPSYAVGVGNIPGLDKTGQWSAAGTDFVAEADEYATDPSAIAAGAELIPRFAYYQPHIAVCTNLKYDHPDVYRDFDHTQQVFADFFKQIKTGGFLVINADDPTLLDLAETVVGQRSDLKLLTFGEAEDSTLIVSNYQTQPGLTTAILTHADESTQLQLKIPGVFNLRNAAAAVLACLQLGIPLAQSCELLADFRSTQRRSEFVGEKQGVMYYDDYAHHPSEVQQVIEAFRDWFPDQKLIVAFQPHTLTRTKALFTQFSTAFFKADELALMDIFTSAREQNDHSVSSDQLAQEINWVQPEFKVQNCHTLEQLAQYLPETAHQGDVVLTLGAGDIYKVHSLIT